MTKTNQPRISRAAIALVVCFIAVTMSGILAWLRQPLPTSSITARTRLATGTALPTVRASETVATDRAENLPIEGVVPADSEATPDGERWLAWNLDDLAREFGTPVEIDRGIYNFHDAGIQALVIDGRVRSLSAWPSSTGFDRLLFAFFGTGTAFRGFAGTIDGIAIGDGSAGVEREWGPTSARTGGPGEESTWTWDGRVSRSVRIDAGGAVTGIQLVVGGPGESRAQGDPGDGAK